MDLMRKIGVSYNAAWRMKHKIMQAMMEREDEKPLAGLVQVDDVYLGGVREGKRGRGAEGKSPFVAALETTEDWLPHRIELQVVAGFRLKAIESWCRRSASPREARSIATACPCFGAVATAGYLHANVISLTIRSRVRGARRTVFRGVRDVRISERFKIRVRRHYREIRA